ncbi:hypothetical protein [Rhodopila sp.]|uniref:hypothetical protein n=1 Tax=Rhodopila sp. TaxID=2480087 RepID=UPI003D12D79D
MERKHESDTEFEEVKAGEVTAYPDGGWNIRRDDGWSFFVPANSPATPKVGDTCRFYGKGIGYAVRGLTINGEVVFYRTLDEEQDHQEHESYGTLPQDVIDKWDAGKTVWSIEMGGFGPGYEQAIQVTAIEILRQMIAETADASCWDKGGGMRAYADTLHEKIGDKLSSLGLSGAQFGAAVSIAARIYKDGPREFVRTTPSDRKIQDPDSIATVFSVTDEAGGAATVDLMEDEYPSVPSPPTPGGPS